MAAPSTRDARHPSSRPSAIKEVLGFRRFSLRGKEKVDAEWYLVCAVHNLGKLFRSGRAGRVLDGWDRPKGRARGSRGLGWA